MINVTHHKGMLHARIGWPRDDDSWIEFLRAEQFQVELQISYKTGRESGYEVSSSIAGAGKMGIVAFRKMPYEHLALDIVANDTDADESAVKKLLDILLIHGGTDLMGADVP